VVRYHCDDDDSTKNEIKDLDAIFGHEPGVSYVNELYSLK
jgi:hypothetical protein